MSFEFEVLLVLDDPEIKRQTKDSLKLGQYQMRYVSDVERLRRTGVQPQVAVAVIDRGVFVGDIEDLLRELQKLLPHADLILVSEPATQEDVVCAFKFGAVDYLFKPLRADAIRQSVMEAVVHKGDERRLAAEHRFANEVLSTAQALILVLDLKGQVVRFNPFFSKLTGWQRDDLIGKDYFEHCIPTDERQWIREVFRRTAFVERTSDVRNRVLMANGLERQIRWSNTTLTDERGEVTSVLAIGIDVTDVVEARNAAAQSERLAAIGQTVAGLAHESRNALHRIQTSAEILQLDIPDDSESQEEVDAILRAATELTNTLEEVRQFAAPIQLHRESVFLPEIWRRVWKYVSSSSEHRVATLTESHCGCDFLVKVDVLRMEQVFRNLFENTFAASADPVRVQIDCRCDGPEWVLLDIRDYGPGLSDEQRKRVFQPFFTTKARGTGLGMSIVQRIIDAHGGRIQVAESNSCGARFLISLTKHDGAVGQPCTIKMKDT